MRGDKSVIVRRRGTFQLSNDLRAKAVAALQRSRRFKLYRGKAAEASVASDARARAPRAHPA
eukprot:136362-Prymnesium_polylepis.1